MQKQHVSYNDYLALFEQYGSTDHNYLYGHYQRFCETQSLFYENWSLAQGHRLLDVGAHWLHQALLYAQDGFKVTAADFAVTIDHPHVQALADAYQIDLFAYTDLSDRQQFNQFPDNAFDVILFSEIIEHITYNPVEMWKGLYRILAPQGRIIITTPNYYFYQGRAWNFKRLFKRMGGGLPVEEILTLNTYGHHWKEFSAREIKHYFSLLSDDFQTVRLEYVDFYPASYKPNSLQAILADKFKIFSKRNIYAEISLLAKNKGISINPGWMPVAEEEPTAPTATSPHGELNIQFTFTAPNQLSWQFAPYTSEQGQYWLYSTIEPNGYPIQPAMPIKMPEQGTHIFPYPPSEPFEIKVQFVADDDWERSSPTLVIDPTATNAQGIVQVSFSNE